MFLPDGTPCLRLAAGNSPPTPTTAVRGELVSPDLAAFISAPGCPSRLETGAGPSVCGSASAIASGETLALRVPTPLSVGSAADASRKPTAGSAGNSAARGLPATPSSRVLSPSFPDPVASRRSTDASALSSVPRLFSPRAAALPSRACASEKARSNPLFSYDRGSRPLHPSGGAAPVVRGLAGGGAAIGKGCSVISTSGILPVRDVIAEDDYQSFTATRQNPESEKNWSYRC